MKTIHHLLAILFLANACPASGGEIEDLTAKANTGDAGAQYSLGMKYSTGEGVSRDPKEAVSWLEQSAMQGNVDAQMALGSLFVSGRGIPRDSVESAKWFQLAAEQGRPDAQIQMARMHLAGTGVVKDDVQAAMWARLAFAQGDKRANRILALLKPRLNGVQTAQVETLVQEFHARKAADDALRGIPMIAPPLE
mgnify:CR=1 FL=1